MLEYKHNQFVNFKGDGYMKLFFGDIHNHCGITYGFGGLENAIKNAKSHLDFCAVTGHAFWPDMPARDEHTAFLIDFHKKGFQKLSDNFDSIKATIKETNEPHKFTTFYSYEMHSSYYGDHHVVSGDDNIKLLYANSPEEWWNKLKDFENTVIIPHHIAYTPGYRGINWDEFNDGICPVVEVCSKHGVSMSDRHPNEYFHNMGARDEHNTVYSGLKKGKVFGFVGSTDHHAGFPGSYGDCLLAVKAEDNTRESIMNAIKARRTYALTADKIKCDFSVNGHDFGEVVDVEKGARNISFSVEASDYIDKVVIFKNLKPIHIVNGELIEQSLSDDTFKVRAEFGWGNNKELYDWDFDICSTGEIIDVEKAFRGKSVLAPKEGETYDDDVNKIEDYVNVIDTRRISGKVQTMANISTTSPMTSAVILTIKGSRDTTITFTVNGKAHTLTIDELLNSSFTYPERNTNSQTFKIHRAVPKSQYLYARGFVDFDDKETFYHMEVKQANGSMAFVSPVYFVDKK